MHDEDRLRLKHCALLLYWDVRAVQENNYWNVLYIYPTVKMPGRKKRSNRQTSIELCVTHTHTHTDSSWVPSHHFAVRWMDCWGMRLRLSLEDLETVYIAVKWERSYCEVKGWVWARLVFAVLRSSIMCLRGASTKWRRLGLVDGAPISLILLGILEIEYSFISALFLYFFQVHPHLKWSFEETFPPVV